MARLRILVVGVAVLLLAACTQLPRRSAEPPLRVLFLGNSLTATNDLPAVVAELAKTFGPRAIEYRTIAPGGASLEDQWNGGTAREAIEAGRWDAVVMQQGPSALPESQANLREWTQRFAAAAREHGARPALLTVWPERYRSNVFADVVASYRNAAAAAKAELLPAGVAWQAAWRRNRALPLYGPDGFHPSELGTYLTAIVVLAGLTGDAPVGLPVSIDGRGFSLQVSASRARLLRDAAAEALRSR